jgi:hypothetical protein
MALFNCENCGVQVSRKREGSRPMRFFSVACSAAFKKGKQPPGGFAKGSEPWNKGVKGLHLSPASEFQKGQRPATWVPIGTVTIRQRKNRVEGPRAWVKVAEPNVWILRAVLIWEATHGPVPVGMVVHHRNRDTLDDSIGNLEAQTRRRHLAEHRREHDEEKRRAALVESWAKRRGA